MEGTVELRNQFPEHEFVEMQRRKNRGEEQTESKNSIGDTRPV